MCGGSAFSYAVWTLIDEMAGNEDGHGRGCHQAHHRSVEGACQASEQPNSRWIRSCRKAPHKSSGGRNCDGQLEIPLPLFEADLFYIGAIETVFASALPHDLRFAKKKLIGCTGKQAAHTAAVRSANDDFLIMSKLAYVGPVFVAAKCAWSSLRGR